MGTFSFCLSLLPCKSMPTETSEKKQNIYSLLFISRKNLRNARKLDDQSHTSKFLLLANYIGK